MLFFLTAKTLVILESVLSLFEMFAIFYFIQDARCMESQFFSQFKVSVTCIFCIHHRNTDIQFLVWLFKEGNLHNHVFRLETFSEINHFLGLPFRREQWVLLRSWDQKATQNRDGGMWEQRAEVSTEGKQLLDEASRETWKDWQMCYTCQNSESPQWTVMCSAHLFDKVWLPLWMFF